MLRTKGQTGGKQLRPEAIVWHGIRAVESDWRDERPIDSACCHGAGAGDYAGRQGGRKGSGSGGRMAQRGLLARQEAADGGLDIPEPAPAAPVPAWRGFAWQRKGIPSRHSYIVVAALLVAFERGRSVLHSLPLA